MDTHRQRDGGRADKGRGQTEKASEAEILNITKLQWDSQGMGGKATVSQVCIGTSGTS